MHTLLLQTFLLFLGAFIAGAALACLFRRIFFRSVAKAEKVIPEPIVIRPATGTDVPHSGSATADAAATARFERALSGEKQAVPVAPAAAKGPVIEVQQPPPSIPAAPAAQPAPPAAPARPPAPPPPVQGVSAGPAIATAAAAAAAASTKKTEPAPAIAATAASTSYDDLTFIRAIDLALQSRLNMLGIRRFEQIASWKASDVNLINQTLGFTGRIEQENWIEQAQILAGGGETDYAHRRKLAGAGVAPAGPEAPAPTRPLSNATTQVTAKPAPSPQPAEPVVSPGAERPFGIAPAIAAAATAAAAPTVAAGKAVPPSTHGAPALPTDRLHRIFGINAAAESILVANGVTRFSQIASWTPADVEKFDALLGRSGRIIKENWIEQAKVLSRETSGEQSAPRPIRLDEAIRDQSGRTGSDESRAAKTDYATLRSIRSEALRPDVPGGAAARSIGTADDLKRIRGVGVLIEKKLNSLGITSYDQVANWTAADIDRISQILDFKGRIERENWVEQARILAAGGQTEFSRRVDRGEVETSKPGK
jgi:predicted flap endonuclease-1-like 5' DNA nuclease